MADQAQDASSQPDRRALPISSGYNKNEDGGALARGHVPQVHPSFIHNSYEQSASMAPGYQQVSQLTAAQPTSSPNEVRNAHVFASRDLTQKSSDTQVKEIMSPKTTHQADGDNGTAYPQDAPSNDSSKPSGYDKKSEGEVSESDKTGNGSKKKSSQKKDRSKLRKGKWTVEEEEYTSRIIHHFSTGLLTLPEGTTLRSYLSEKLNCDPMRITKKFAGASCLGKRVYHLCDRSQATVTDIEMAKTELARLEHRFRLRVEHGQSGVPLPPRTDVIPSLPAGATNVYQAPGHQPHAASASWLQSLAQMAPPTAGTVPLAPNTTHTTQPAATWTYPAQPGTQWLAPNTLPSAAPVATVPQAPAPTVQATNDAITTWAWAQAAASLTPALSQLAAANIQQHQQQLQKAYESQLQSYAQQHQAAAAPATAPATAPVTAPVAAHQPTPAPLPPPSATPATHTVPTQPQQAQEQPAAPPAPTQLPQSQPKPMHFMPARPLVPVQNAPAAMAPPPSVMISPQTFNVATYATNPSTPLITPQPPRMETTSVPQMATTPVQPAPSATPLVTATPSKVVLPSPQAAAIDKPPSPSRSKEDEDAGTMLMGFLTSLRQGFMQAKNQKDKEELERQRQQQLTTKRQPAVLGKSPSESNETSSGTTSHPADSSMEDSESDKGKTDPSSSEDSDKDNGERRLGPPRKRLKKGIVGEFTSQNVAAHNDRMDALHRERNDAEGPYR